ncbi:TrkA family potassium uptake protein [Corynebacterium sp. TAE3-ERU12]|uniref:potassium channel family protein n=1 Tax=Corynebacterium sp. TAE3-ERU12 TaxID=2849491 RepID=UPI001C45CFC3|nr:TrkA family potassium uptake protein [Corynebacterium sp. TAE3-ERU12]MBV7295876.1 TrkA family potassium uptake protein [Corynebacterium sp. TAE3-ERU12]
MARKHNSHVVILGLGRFGQALGEELMSGGVEVLGVDSDSRRVQMLSDSFDHIVHADTTIPGALQELGVHEAKRVVVAIGADLEASLLTTSAVVDFGVPSIWAKADSPAHAKILSQIGCHHVIRPEADTGRRVAHLIGGGVQEYVEFDHDFAVARIAPPVSALGHRVGEINASGDVEILGLRQGGQRFRRALADDVLAAGDLVLAGGPARSVESFAARS